jgi:hypothetical protein
VKVEASLGDVVDRLTILRIKAARIAAEPARVNVRAEAAALEAAWAAAGLPAVEALEEWGPLLAVNEALWEVEDRLRDLERQGDFGADFLAAARSVYFTNDRRAALKRAINLRLGSTIIEEKSYQPYA